MLKKIKIYLLITFAAGSMLRGQTIIPVERLINGQDATGGSVEIIQDPRIDTLLSRHIEANRSYNGFEGFRIQIYRGSGRDAREAANEAMSKFIEEFPGIKAYIQFDQPNYFKVRAGDYRTRNDAYPDFIIIVKKFPNAYIVNDKINFPDLDKQ